MSDEQRLDAILAALRDTPAPAIACDAHAAQMAALADPTAPLDIDALAAAVDCTDCVAVLDAHPVLRGELLDLPVPPPVIPLPGRRIPWGVFALAAAVLLFTWAVFRPSPPANVAVIPAPPGPVAAGHPSYGYVELANPHTEGLASYSWVERPAQAEEYRFHALDPGPVALNHSYSPWVWR